VADPSVVAVAFLPDAVACAGLGLPEAVRRGIGAEEGGDAIDDGRGCGVGGEAATDDGGAIPGVAGEFQGAVDQNPPAAGASGATEDLGAPSGHQVAGGGAREAAWFGPVAAVAHGGVLGREGGPAAAGDRRVDRRVEGAVAVPGPAGEAGFREDADQAVGDLVLVPDRPAAGDAPDHVRVDVRREARQDRVVVLEVAQGEGRPAPGVGARGGSRGGLEERLVEGHVPGAVVAEG